MGTGQVDTGVRMVTQDGSTEVGMVRGLVGGLYWCVGVRRCIHRENIRMFSEPIHCMLPASALPLSAAGPCLSCTPLHVCRVLCA